MARKPNIGELRWTVTITNWRETPDDDVNITRERPEIFTARAQIKKRGFVARESTPSFDHFQPDSGGQPTHTIIMRRPRDVLITGRMWVYARKRDGLREWYQILSVSDHDERGRFVALSVRLDDVHDPRADAAVIETPKDANEPDVIIPAPTYGGMT